MACAAEKEATEGIIVVGVFKALSGTTSKVDYHYSHVLDSCYTPRLYTSLASIGI